MNQQQGSGSKAMTIYIVVLFVLSAAALVGFKIMNDKRSELAAEYGARYQNVVDIQGALYPSINDYYKKVKNGDIRTVNFAVKRDTHAALRAIAEAVGRTGSEGGIRESTGPDDRLDIEVEPGVNKKQYMEYACTVTLKNVTQSEWAQFLRDVLDPYKADNVLDEYVNVASIEAGRVETTYKKMVPSGEAGGRYVDRSPWKVVIKFTWFASMEEANSA